ncbi:hypothetical protein, partial [Xanthomonas graminis]|uniref:hypothetical protein n=1 Tax=Xanthomonas graminis TaxID=3390026 RepID=UPI001C49E8A7
MNYMILANRRSVVILRIAGIRQNLAKTCGISATRRTDVAPRTLRRRRAASFVGGMRRDNLPITSRINTA